MRVRVLHRALSRKVVGSRNWIKARIRLARAYEHLANLRRDYAEPHPIPLGPIQGRGNETGNPHLQRRAAHSSKTKIRQRNSLNYPMFYA